MCSAIALPNDPVRVIPSPDSRHVLLVFADYDDGHNRELAQSWDLSTGAPVSDPFAMEAGDNLRFGAGIGGRFYTNFGPMRLDLATPINRRPGEARITVYVSIGQAF